MQTGFLKQWKLPTGGKVVFNKWTGCSVAGRKFEPRTKCHERRPAVAIFVGKPCCGICKSPVFVGTFHVTSRNILSLTAHVAHTTAPNLLISFQCHSNPSKAHSKICAQKTVFSRSSSLFSSVHCTHSAHETVTAHAPYSPSPPHFSIGKAVNMRDRGFDNRR